MRLKYRVLMRLTDIGLFIVSVIGIIIMIAVSICVGIFVFFPSVIYGIAPLVTQPVGTVAGLLMRRPSWGKKQIVTLKFTTPFVLIIMPVILFLCVSEVIGVIWFSWMLAYLITRFFNEAHKRELMLRHGIMGLDALEQKFAPYHIESNPLVGLATIILSAVSLVVSYLIGEEVGLVVGAVIAVVLLEIGQRQYKVKSKEEEGADK